MAEWSSQAAALVDSPGFAWLMAAFVGLVVVALARLASVFLMAFDALAGVPCQAGSVRQGLLYGAVDEMA